jgi:hypothetical protein
MSGNLHPLTTTKLAGWRITDLIAEVDRQHRSQLAQPGGRCLPSSVEATASRRAIARVLAGGAFAGLAGRFGVVEESSAKRKRKKKKKVCWGAAPVYCSPTADEPMAYCYPDGATCCSSAQGGGACPPGSECCHPSPLEPAGSCSPTGYRCCPAATGSFCPQFAPNCCPPTPQDPLGLCMPTGNQCCTAAQGGGFCREDETCCPPSAGFPHGTCAPPGVPCPQRGDLAPARQGVRERRMEHPEGTVAMTTSNPDSWK